MNFPELLYGGDISNFIVLAFVVLKKQACELEPKYVH